VVRRAIKRRFDMDWVKNQARGDFPLGMTQRATPAGSSGTLLEERMGVPWERGWKLYEIAPVAERGEGGLGGGRSKLLEIKCGRGGVKDSDQGLVAYK